MASSPLYTIPQEPFNIEFVYNTFMSDLSIIILSYNTCEVTKKCLETVIESLKKAYFSTEIIIIDNNSSDGSVEMLREFENKNERAKNNNIQIKFIESKDNLGFSKANNLAVKQAEGKIVLLLNSDIIVLGNAIPRLYEYFVSQHNHFNFLGGKLLEKDGSTPQSSSGPFYSLPVAFIALFLKGDSLKITRYSPVTIKEVDWISGACIMCNKKDFSELGGFDEGIFMYMDEIDLLYRAKQKNMRVGFFPDAQFIHLGSASSGSRKQPILQVFKGFLYFYKKHHSKRSYAIMKRMLQLKAQIGLAIGKLTGNTYLTETYGEAQTILKNS